MFGKKSTIKETMNLKELKVGGYMGRSEGRKEGRNYIIISKQFFIRMGLEIWLGS